MTSTLATPITRSAEIKNSVAAGTGVFSFLVTGDDTNGQFALLEIVQRPGNEPPYHIHEREDEIFYLLEGRVSVMADGVVYDLAPGASMFLPRGVPHTFRIRSAIARTLLMVTPAGFENYFRELGSPAKAMLPPADATRIANYFEVAGKAAARQGIRLADTQPEF